MISCDAGAPVHVSVVHEVEETLRAERCPLFVDVHKDLGFSGLAKDRGESVQIESGVS